MDDRPRYTISVAAELCGMHPQTLRMYEARGLVRPRRTPGGTRRYSEDDLAKLRQIGHLTTELGLNLTGAERVLALVATIAELTARVLSLEEQLAGAARVLQAEVDRVHRSYRRDLVLYRKPSTPTKRWTSAN
jgi:MerR family transcriptional regulator/heat shock protein HspR